MATPLTVYLSGPMTGYPDYNRPAFQAAAAELRAAGYVVLSPAELPAPPPPASWADYVRLDLAEVLAAEAVAVLPGWECSRGARLEVDVAQALGLPVLPLPQWLTMAGQALTPANPTTPEV